MGRSCLLWHLWRLRAAIHPRAEGGQGPGLSWSCRGPRCQLGRGRGGFMFQEREGCALTLYSSKELNKERETRRDGERGGGAAGQTQAQELQGVQWFGPSEKQLWVGREGLHSACPAVPSLPRQGAAPCTPHRVSSLCWAPSPSSSAIEGEQHWVLSRGKGKPAGI